MGKGSLGISEVGVSRGVQVHKKQTNQTQKLQLYIYICFKSLFGVVFDS